MTVWQTCNFTRMDEEEGEKKWNIYIFSSEQLITVADMKWQVAPETLANCVKARVRALVSGLKRNCRKKCKFWTWGTFFWYQQRKIALMRQLTTIQGFKWKSLMQKDSTMDSLQVHFVKINEQNSAWMKNLVSCNWTETINGGLQQWHAFVHFVQLAPSFTDAGPKEALLLHRTKSWYHWSAN